MRILGKEWREGYLDYHMSDRDVRIAVKAWLPLETLRDVYFLQPNSIRRVFNYVREVGFRVVLKKIMSRRAEWLRNIRVIAVGGGEVLEVGQRARGLEPGAPVVFIAPCHPMCVERIVLPAALVSSVGPEVLSQVAAGDGIALFENQPLKHVPAYAGLAGWHQFSGLPLPAERGRLLAWAEEEFKSAEVASARRLSVKVVSPVEERTGTRAVAQADRRLTACIFGLGNYAKTCILPNIDPRIRVAGIHEIDPTQLGRKRRRECVYDTCGFARPDEKYDIYFVAGYHHTHADLAVHGLRAGAWVVLEKPLVTSSEQLDRLLDAMREHPGRLFTGFHKRFNPLLNLARSDMVHRPGLPIHYSCIVYEVPLPGRHWYKWPNLCSRLVSNGCHWMDQFLFLNDFCRYTRCAVWRGANGDAHVSAELENGAVFGMILTDRGSRRIGVQDHIELRSSGVTVKIDNDNSYVAEDDYRILRRASINKFDLYKYTYGGHCRKIFAGAGGASIESVEQTCRLMLEVEKLWQEQRPEEK